MQVVTRFAPSPTGKLHLGHAWSALQAHDFARARNGAFLLRIEDIDPGRARPEHVDSIIEDLLWLGLQWDGEIAYQSERLDLYADALEQLRRDDLVYPCFCTRAEAAAEIAASASAPHGPDGPVYPGTCRRLSATERTSRSKARPHAWRLDMVRACAQAGPLHWYEGDRLVPASPETFGDVVIARKDAPASYHLAVTIDDSTQGVSDVVRGADLRSSTHVHRLLQALLGLRSPVYHHHPLLLDLDGRRLAKRHAAPGLNDLREAGHDPAELVKSLRSREMPAGYILDEA